uniref:Potassium channel domain-containing protein n=1 Tax=Acrobeloides nanus TaxID=290746 RepID=A0A914BU85_9BILA
MDTLMHMIVLIKTGFGWSNKFWKKNDRLIHLHSVIENCTRLENPSISRAVMKTVDLDDNHQFIRAFRVFCPQLLIVGLLLCYLLAGAFIYQLIDEKIAEDDYYDVVLFAFTTIATIGYGNIYPSNDTSRIFTIVYAIFGIPLCLLTLANLGKHLMKSYWMVLICLGKNIRRRPTGEANLPIKVIICLFFVTVMFGALLFPEKAKFRTFTVEQIYFSVISFATVGFGDISATAHSFLRLILVLSYLSWGMMLMATLFSALSRYLRKLRYAGRRFYGAREVHVWFGGHRMKVSRLLEIIGTEFNASPRQVQHVLQDLDNVISEAVVEAEQRRKASTATSHE